MTNEELKDFISYFFTEDIDYKIMDYENKKYVAFTCPTLLKLVVKKECLLHYKNEFPNVEGEKLIDYIAEYCIREGICFEEECIKSEFFN